MCFGGGGGGAADKLWSSNEGEKKQAFGHSVSGGTVKEIEGKLSI